jgi:hypothetical protein
MLFQERTLYAVRHFFLFSSLPLCAHVRLSGMASAHLRHAQISLVQRFFSGEVPTCSYHGHDDLYPLEPLLDALGVLALSAQDAPRYNGFRFFRLDGLNDLRLLVLHHLFHLPFFLHHEQGARDAHCVLVLLPLSEQDGRDVKHPHALDVQNEKIRHVSDDQVLLS